MYAFHRPYGENLENHLAVAMQLEILLTVYFALLESLHGGSRDPDDERGWGVVLTVGTVSCLLFGLLIVSAATCKLSPHDPTVKALTRSALGSTGNDTVGAISVSRSFFVTFELLMLRASQTDKAA